MVALYTLCLPVGLAERETHPSLPVASPIQGHRVPLLPWESCIPKLPSSTCPFPLMLQPRGHHREASEV